MKEERVSAVSKRICLIADGHPLWREVKKFLGAVSAEVLALYGQPEAERIVSFEPQLIVTSAREHHRLLHRIRRYPVIVIREGTPPVALVREAEERNLVLTGWPLGQEQFLELTSRMLSVAPRKEFRTLIRVFRPGELVSTIGESRNFSKSGMAFTTGARLRRGSRVAVSFSLPDDSRSLRLGAEVVRVRVSRNGDEVFYGACFEKVPAREAALLNAFVMS